MILIQNLVRPIFNFCRWIFVKKQSGSVVDGTGHDRRWVAIWDWHITVRSWWIAPHIHYFDIQVLLFRSLALKRSQLDQKYQRMRQTLFKLIRISFVM